MWFEAGVAGQLCRASKAKAKLLWRHVLQAPGVWLGYFPWFYQLGSGHRGQGLWFLGKDKTLQSASCVLLTNVVQVAWDHATSSRSLLVSPGQRALNPVHSWRRCWWWLLKFCDRSASDESHTTIPIPHKGDPLHSQVYNPSLPRLTAPCLSSG